MNELYNFDMDGTLVDSKRIIKKCQAEALERAAHIGRRHFEEMLRHYPLDNILADYQIDKDEFFNVHYKTFDPYAAVKTGDMRVIGDSKRYLNEIKDKGNILSLASNSSYEATENKLKAVSLFDLFNYITAEYSKERSKPSPYMAESLADMMGDKIHYIDRITNIGDRVVDMEFGEQIMNVFSRRASKDYELRNYLLGRLPSTSGSYVNIDRLSDIGD